MNVTWTVDEGFHKVGSPRITEIPDAEIAECSNTDDALTLIRQYVQEDFDESVSPCWPVDEILGDVVRLMNEGEGDG